MLRIPLKLVVESQMLLGFSFFAQMFFKALNKLQANIYCHTSYYLLHIILNFIYYDGAFYFRCIRLHSNVR